MILILNRRVIVIVTVHSLVVVPANIIGDVVQRVLACGIGSSIHTFLFQAGKKAFHNRVSQQFPRRLMLGLMPQCLSTLR